jgi:hypothetical protein
VADACQNSIIVQLSERLESLYSVGSYAFGKIALDKPDLNCLLILKGYASPKDYLAIGKICRNLMDDFKDKCSVRVEFRPFRYIYSGPTDLYEIFLNPIITSTQEIASRGFIFTKWFTQGLKESNRLLHGRDFLTSITVSDISRGDLVQGALFDLPFFTIPLTRAPAQYGNDESELLFNEALTNGKNMCYLGLEIAMTEQELKARDYLKYIKDKGTISGFYKERYGDEAGQLVAKIFDAREHYLEYRKDRAKAEEIFSTALRIANLLQERLFSSDQ